ncbi:MAG: hypothetical protein RM368_06405 [Nostoc sp. DedSLP03]|uniref:hypothetical protein n=1 Tax=Nostoc sp. DedSLP03 TaxID=3075400 RepID=UPI002AD4CA38|nr:hypothetical protein [Nostoc sp. DedSLP03]MDZ7964593.1 hypothetical protein [Nostoc sp. DedSLP03]
MSKAAEDQLDTWMTNHAWNWNTTQRTIANLAIKEQVIGDKEKEREQGAAGMKAKLYSLKHNFQLVFQQTIMIRSSQPCTELVVLYES